MSAPRETYFCRNCGLAIVEDPDAKTLPPWRHMWNDQLSCGLTAEPGAFEVRLGL